MNLDGYINTLLRSPSGLGTVADLRLPREFLERIAGRSLRAHYRLTHRPLPRDSAHESSAEAASTAASAGEPLPIRTLNRPTIAVSGARARSGGVPHVRDYRWNDYVPADPWPASADAAASGAGSADALALAESVAAAQPCRTIPAFEALDQAQPHEPAVVRWQLPTDRYGRGRGDGSTLDVVRQVAERLAGGRHVIVAASGHAAGLAREFRGRPNVEVVASPLEVGQWGCDNAVVGRLGPSGRPAILLPRFAGRNEQHSVLMPGDCIAPWALQGAVGAIARSPLHFQGGNLMTLARPDGARILLLGEAEVCRNVVLGLSRAQVLDAFRAEFGVDRVEVLPAVSFHIDVELTLRRVAEQVVACVVDELAAARVAVRCGLAALERSSLISGKQHATLGRDIERGDALPAWSVIQRAIAPVLSKNPAALASVSAAWSMRSTDYPLATLSRFCVASDIVTAASTSTKELAASGLTPAAKQYLASFQRRAAERERMHATLASLDLALHRIPTMSDEECIVNHLNGVHTSDAYLMPAWGGVLNELDAAAGNAFAAAFGGVAVTGVPSAGVQIGHGGLHCMCSVVPRTA